MLSNLRASLFGPGVKKHLGFQFACAFWHFELMFGLVLAAFSSWFHPRRKCCPPSAVVRNPGSSASCHFSHYGSIRKLRNKLAPKKIGVFEQLIIGNSWIISVSNTGTWPCLQNLICIICLAETNTCTSLIQWTREWWNWWNCSDPLRLLEGTAYQGGSGNI